MQNTISIFGLGKLGTTMLACFAYKGYNVIGVDTNPAAVNSINKRQSHIYEPKVGDLLQDSLTLISATLNPQEAVEKSSASFIIVPTPSTPEGDFSLKYVEQVIISIGNALKVKTGYHLVIITSTVLPGDTDRMCKLLEEVSGKKCGVDFGLCYNPDFIALGKIVHDFLNPDMILIGESDEYAGSLLENIHLGMINNTPPIHRMSFCNAELAKITLNTYCVMKINFANVIGEICEKMPRGDARKVLAAVGADSRVGQKYFKAGLAASGPCFPRDSRAFASSAKKYGVSRTFAETIQSLNDYNKNERILNLVEKYVQPGDVVTLLGLTYKENVQLVEEATQIELSKSLTRKGYRVHLYDPAGMPMAQLELKGCAVHFFDDALSCLLGSSLCIVGTPWEDFKRMVPTDFKGMKHLTVVDVCNLFDETDSAWSDVRLIKIGKNPDQI